MKKVLIILSTFILILSFASITMAACYGDNSGSKTYTLQDPDGNQTDISIAPSRNVDICFNVDTNNGTSYAAVSKHKNGNRCYGAASDTQRLYYSTSSNCAKGQIITTSIVTASDSSAFSSWTSL